VSGKGKPWDLTSTHALEGAAEWIRKRADASVVLVVRGGDYAFAVAPDVAPEAAYDAAQFVLPDALDGLRERRQREQEEATRKRAAAIATKTAALR
jgi:hypothetical protein